MNKIRKHDSTASPTPASATYGPATAGIQYDLKTDGGLHIIPSATVGWDLFDLGKITGKSSDHLKLNSSGAGKSVRINVRTISTDEDESFIGFVSKPGIGITHANSKELKGGEISPRLNDGVAWPGSVIGLHIDTYIKGTTASAIGGDVRVLQLEIVGDAGGQKTVDGYVTGIRVKSYLPAAAVTGVFSAFRIEETESGGTAYDTLFDLTGVQALAWHDTDTAVGGTAAGYFAVQINGNQRWVKTYSDAPST